jgi:fructokinase
LTRIGIDLGGTKIEIIALDASGAECFRRRIATPREDYEGTLATIATLVHDAEAIVGRATVGIGMRARLPPSSTSWIRMRSFWAGCPR